MPKLELKAVQRELEQGMIWPVYWLYGPERLKSRELLNRIRKAVFGDESSEASSWAWDEETFEGSETDSTTILDSARSPSLAAGVRFIVIRDAHALKAPEHLSELLGPPQKRSELTSVCVCISKDLDARKKFSKALIEKAAVVSCEELSEDQREPWIQYLAKRRGLEISPALVMQLNSLDPWSLDIVEQELEKFSVAGSSADVVLESAVLFGGADKFLESFFSRDLPTALSQVSRFANHPDEALPLLGLLSWNVRQLAVLIADRENGTRHAKLNPYLADRFKKWSTQWKLAEVVDLQSELFHLDFGLKQTPLLPLALWSQLVTRYCRE